MAASDFLSEFHNSSSLGYGAGIINSSLSNPLVSSVQCRALDPLKTNSSFLQNHFWISENKDGGAYVNIPYTKSISQRIWARINYTTNHTAGGSGGAPVANHPGDGVALFAKHSNYNSVLNLNWHQYPNSGYEFIYGRSSGKPGRDGLLFNAGGYKKNIARSVESYGSVYYIETATPDTKISTPPTNDTWIGLRMDVVPVKSQKIINGVATDFALKDIVTLYTASVSTPNNWVQIYTTEITETDPRWVPWGSYQIDPVVSEPYGSDYVKVDSRVGFGVRSQATAVGNRNLIYWDDYQIYVVDAF